MNTILAVVIRLVEHKLLMIAGLGLIVLGLLLADEGLTWQTMAAAMIITPVVGVGVGAAILWIYLFRTAGGGRQS